MAIVSVRERATGRDGSVEKADPPEADRRTYRRVFVIETDDELDGFASIVAHPSIPALGSNYSTPGEIDLGSVAQSIDGRQLGPMTWEAVVAYGPLDVEGGDPAQGDPNPLHRPPVVTLTTASVQLPMYGVAAIDDPAVDPPSFVQISNLVPLASSGYPFDPIPTFDAPVARLRVERNVAVFQPIASVNVVGTVNSRRLTTSGELDLDDANDGQINAERACVIQWSAESRFENGVPYYREAIEIEIRDQYPVQAFAAWQFDKGRYKLDGSDLKVIQDVDGYPVPVAVPLGGDGDIAGPVLYEFRKYSFRTTFDFASLNIGFNSS